MRKKFKRLTKEEIEFIQSKSSDCSNITIANIIGCSVGTVNYYRYRGIWKGKRR